MNGVNNISDLSSKSETLDRHRDLHDEIYAYTHRPIWRPPLPVLAGPQPYLAGPVW